VGNKVKPLFMKMNPNLGSGDTLFNY